MEFFASGEGRLFLLLAIAAALVSAWFLVKPNRAPAGRRIRVVGVGGAGANAIDAMIRGGLRGVEYVAVNTDLRALNRTRARRLAIGRSTTHGLGTGGDAGVGETAARESAEAIGQALAGADLVVVVAGLGGGTGSGAAPVVAEIARGQGALTVAVATEPFAFEGLRKTRVARDAERALAGVVDALATVPSDHVRASLSTKATVDAAFRAIDDAVHCNVAEIVRLVAAPGRISLDFADVRAVLRGGSAAIGIGHASGEHRATEATRTAMRAPLLEQRLSGAEAVLVNVNGPRSLRLAELDAVADTVLSTSGRDTNLILGVSWSRRQRDGVQVTLIAAGARTAATTPVGTASADGEFVPAEGETDGVAAISGEPQRWRPAWLRPAEAGSGHQAMAAAAVSAPPSTPAPEAVDAPAAPSRARAKRRRGARAGHREAIAQSDEA